MNVGPTTVTLKDVSILQERMNAGIDVLFSNLGQDLFDSFDSFTLNFSKMTFSADAARQNR